MIRYFYFHNYTPEHQAEDAGFDGPGAQTPASRKRPKATQENRRGRRPLRPFCRQHTTQSSYMQRSTFLPIATISTGSRPLPCSSSTSPGLGNGTQRQSLRLRGLPTSGRQKPTRGCATASLTPCTLTTQPYLRMQAAKRSCKGLDVSCTTLPLACLVLGHKL